MQKEYRFRDMEGDGIKKPGTRTRGGKVSINVPPPPQPMPQSNDNDGRNRNTNACSGFDIRFDRIESMLMHITNIVESNSPAPDTDSPGVKSDNPKYVRLGCLLVIRDDKTGEYTAGSKRFKTLEEAKAFSEDNAAVNRLWNSGNLYQDQDKAKEYCVQMVDQMQRLLDDYIAIASIYGMPYSQLNQIQFTISNFIEDGIEDTDDVFEVSDIEDDEDADVSESNVDIDPDDIADLDNLSLSPADDAEVFNVDPTPPASLPGEIPIDKAELDKLIPLEEIEDDTVSASSNLQTYAKRISELVPQEKVEATLSAARNRRRDRSIQLQYVPPKT